MVSDQIWQLIDYCLIGVCQCLKVNHAEMNAIWNRTETNLEECIMFITTFPCSECAKMILQSGLKQIVYLADSSCQKQTAEQLLMTKQLFDMSGIAYYKLD